MHNRAKAVTPRPQPQTLGLLLTRLPRTEPACRRPGSSCRPSAASRTEPAAPTFHRYRGLTLQPPPGAPPPPEQLPILSAEGDGIKPEIDAQRVPTTVNRTPFHGMPQPYLLPRHPDAARTPHPPAQAVPPIASLVCSSRHFRPTATLPGSPHHTGETLRRTSTPPLPTLPAGPHRGPRVQAHLSSHISSGRWAAHIPTSRPTGAHRVLHSTAVIARRSTKRCRAALGHPTPYSTLPGLHPPEPARECPPPLRTQHRCAAPRITHPNPVAAA
jgi:hypothetical protein